MKSKLQCPNRRRQRGQTVLWFLATMAACCCVLALVYNVGQVTNHKEQTINAADAAALSGALVEARMLNFEAYTNRAMIANEVTIAQLVSLDSWVAYDNELMQWIATYTAIVPYLDDVTQAIADVSQVVADAVNAAAQAAVPAIEGMNKLLWLAREYANYAGAPAANDIAGKIANANSTISGGPYDTELVPSLSPVLLALNEYEWSFKFTDPYTGNGRANGKEVILNSRDPFSTNRGNGYLIDALNIGLKIAGLVGSAGLTYFGLEKTSGTTTLQDYDHWAAQDSLDLTLTTANWCGPLCGYSTNVVPFGPPLGYGRADADTDGSVGNDLCNYKPPTTNCTFAVQTANTISWSGMPNIRDLAQDLAKDQPCSKNNISDSPTLSFTAAVQRDGKATLTTQRIGIGTVDVTGPQGSPGSAQSNDKLQNGDKLTSISAACIFFLRPDLNTKDITEGSLARADGVHEYASLYNPYWQARLTVPDVKWTTLLYAVIGQPGLNLVTP